MGKAQKVNSIMINLIFFTVFLCQIILISMIYSKKMCDQSMHILETCPPSDYPKLYENSKYAYPGKRLRERSVIIIG